MDKWSMQLTIWKGKMGTQFDNHCHATVHELSAEKLRALIKLLEPEVFAQPRDTKGHFIKSKLDHPTNTNVKVKT